MCVGGGGYLLRSGRWGEGGIPSQVWMVGGGGGTYSGLDGWGGYLLRSGWWGGGVPTLGGGYLPWWGYLPWGGTYLGGVPTLGRGVPTLVGGTYPR